MKISIEFKENKYTIIFGKLIGKGATTKDAVEALVNAFREQVNKFFPVQ